MQRPLVVLAMLAAPGAALAADDICVQNATPETYVFTLENAAGLRARARLAPGAELCLSAARVPGGVAAAFTRETSVEGCARLLPETGRDVLLSYASFDRCRWASHGN